MILVFPFSFPYDKNLRPSRCAVLCRRNAAATSSKEISISDFDIRILPVLSLSMRVNFPEIQKDLYAILTSVAFYLPPQFSPNSKTLIQVCPRLR